jgi:hypothetical protein
MPPGFRRHFLLWKLRISFNGMSMWFQATGETDERRGFGGKRTKGLRAAAFYCLGLLSHHRC